MRFIPPLFGLALALLVWLSSVVLVHAQGTAVRGVGPDDEPVLASDEQEKVEEQATEIQEADVAAPVEDLDADLERLDGYLDAVEASTRRYFFSWLTVGTGLVASQAWVARNWDSNVVRGSYLIGTALGSASLGLQLIAPKPALFGVRKYRRMPAGSDEEKRSRIEFGQRILAGQAKADMRATSVVQHITGLLASLGSGLGVGLGWDNSLKQAITRSLGVFLVAELQIISRPRTSIELMDEWSKKSSSLQVAVVPLLEPYAQGLMLAGTF